MSIAFWLATYPNDYTALINSALLHKQLGDRSEAIRSLELGTQVAPDQPLAWAQSRPDLLRSRRLRKRQARAQTTRSSCRTRQAARHRPLPNRDLTGDLKPADEQVAAVRGRRDEVDMVAIRMFGAAYRGRLTEAAELAIEYQNRMAALSRESDRQGRTLMALAISEAARRAAPSRRRTRVSAAYDEASLNEARWTSGWWSPNHAGCGMRRRSCSPS